MANKSFSNVIINVDHLDLSKDTSRSVLVTGENLSHSLGKIARWYKDISWSGHKHTESDISDFGTYAGSSTKGGAATSANKLNIGNADIGSETKPVYFSNTTGKPVACTYSLNASVPSGAVFTDEKVKQSPVSTDASYEVLFAGSTGNTEKTEGVGKTTSLTFNPKTGALTASSFSGSLAATNLTGTINAARLPDTTVVVGSYGPAANASPAHGGTFSVPYVTVDRYGRLTAASTKTITLPAQYTHPSHTAAESKSGLYKITVDALGHVTGTDTVTKSDIPALDYLPLNGGTMNLGEGLKFHADENYFGTNLDARIISLLDGNGTVCDGGLIIDERATNNGTVTVTELLRIRHDEFKWKGTNISLSGHTHTKSEITDFPTKLPADGGNADTVDNYHASAFLLLSGGTMTGTITTKTSASHTGVKLGDTYLTAINGDTIFQNNTSIRFGTDSWDYDKWAGLKFDATNKIVYLGIADKSIFSANNALSQGIVQFPGISELRLKHATNATVSVSDKTNPRITFSDSDGSQYISLIYSDYDSYQSPDSLTLVGNQSGSYFIAPNIKATGKFYGTLSGNASTSSSAERLSNTSAIGSATQPVYFTDKGIPATCSVATGNTANTLVARDGNGYIRAVYYNASCNAETPTTSSYIIYANSDGWFRKSSLDNINSILKTITNAGASPNCGDGTVITQPTDTVALSIRTTDGKSRDAGIIRLSQDSCYIANSADVGYAFGVYDTDKTQDMSSTDTASFVVLQNYEGCKMRGSLLSTGEFISTSSNAYRLCYGGYGAFLRNDGSDLWILLTDKKTDGSEKTASYNSLRPFRINLATGQCYINGCTIGKSVPSNGVFTDIHVTQSVTTTTNFRPIILGYQNDATHSTLENTVTEQVYATNKIYAQPSTGTIYATSFSGNASSASKLSNTSAIGSATQPVYFTSGGIPSACSYTLGRTVYPAYSISGGNTANYPYRLVCGMRDKTTGYKDYLAIFRIVSVYDGQVPGIYQISVRMNYNGTSSVALRLISGYPFLGDVGRSQVGYQTTSTDTYAYLIVKAGTYPRARVEVIYNSGFTFYSSNEPNDTTTTDSKGATHAYASMATAGSTLVGGAFSSTITAASVNNFASRLSNTAAIGSTTKGVYFTSGGIPEACSYTLGKDVPGSAVFTDANVTQTASDSQNAWYEILTSVTADNTTRTEGARKSLKLRFNNTGSTLAILGTTSNSSAYNSTNPSIRFLNSDSSQNLELVYTDHDTVLAPSSLNLTGNQGGEWFTAPNIMAWDVTNHTNSASMRTSSCGTTSAIGVGQVIIGNSVAEGTAGNSKGYLQIYDKTAYRVQFSATATTNREISIPDMGGTMAIQSWNCIAAVTRGADSGITNSGYWSGMTTKHGYTGVAANKWRHVLSMDWSGSDLTNWQSQLLIPTQDSYNATSIAAHTLNDGIAYRTNPGSGKALTDTWITLVDTANYLNILDSRFFTVHYDADVNNGVDWNTKIKPGTYKVQMGSWGDATTMHSPNSAISNLYSYGTLIVLPAGGTSGEYRLIQIYIPHQNYTSQGIFARQHNSTKSDYSDGWQSWSRINPNDNTTYSTVSKTATGLCPQLPNETATTKYLRQDGTWQVPPDTNTWRGIQDNLTSTSTTDSLSAAAGKALNDKFANYQPKGSNPYMKAILGGSSYYQMAPEDQTSVWVRTTTPGLIPNTSGDSSRTDGSSLGTSSWYFYSAYIKNIYGNIYTTVTEPSTQTSYGILFVANPGTSEANTLRKCNDIRFNHFRGAANTEGISEIVLGNSTAKTAANNSSGRVSWYNANGKWAHLNAGSYTSNIDINLPSSAGTLALVGDNNHTHSYIPLSGSSSITGELSTSSANGFRLYNGGYGAFLRNDGTNLYILLTDKKTDGSEKSGNNWNSLRPFYLNLSTGSITMGCSVTMGKSATIYYSSFEALRIRRTGEAYGASIGFSNGATEKMLGYIGMTGDANGGLLRWKADTTVSYVVIDTGNKDSYTFKPSSHTHSYAAAASAGAGSTKVHVVVKTPPSSVSSSYILFATTTGADSDDVVQKHGNITYRTLAGSTSAEGWTEIALGNTTATGTDGNSTGWLMLYGDKGYNVELGPAVSMTKDIDIRLPVSGGSMTDIVYKASSYYLPCSGGTLTANVTLTESKSLILRTNASYLSGIGYDTQGNECVAIWAKNTVTRLRWHAGVDMSATTYTKMMSITPDFEVSKADGTAKGYIAGNRIDVQSKLWAGSTSCGARTSTTITFTTAITASKFRTVKVFWATSNSSGVSEFRADTLNILNNVMTASTGTDSNIVQFKIASDGKTMTVGPGTTAITVLVIIACDPV